MSNPVKGQTPLVLRDGREFTLVLDHEALLEAEQAANLPLPKLMAQASQGFVGAAASIAQGAFARYHPEITKSDVLAMLLGPDAERLTLALGKASEAAFNAPSAEGNAKAAPARRGKTSGRSGAKRG